MTDRCPKCNFSLEKQEFYERGYKYRHLCPNCQYETPWFDSHHRETTPHLSWLILQEKEKKKVKP